MIIKYGVGYGLVLSVLFTAAVFAGAAVSRDFLLNDHPPASRRGAPVRATGRNRRSATASVAARPVALR
ncbi:hypothetical protein [Streptomyces hygroscopicus]|uniref:hypothetical protein n=1 Tax=Streptomyces hygroscopicus TaxID=1912 RepID=UPI0004C7A5BC|nr:hypothetical protein [Streptomyces hygroscopicus]